MKQATRSLLTLVVVGAVGAAIAVVAWQRSTEKALAGGEEADKSLFHRQAAEVKAIDIEVKGNPVRVEKQIAGWRITKPVQMGADEQQVERLLTAVGNMQVRTEYGTVEQPEVPEETLTGLDTPDARITLTLDDGAQWTLERGGQSEYNRDHFFRLKDAAGETRVGTISPSSAQAIERTWASFRDKRVAGTAADRIRALRVEPGEPGPENIVYEVKRLPPDPDLPAYRQRPQFESITPPVGAADAAAVIGALKSLNRAPLTELVVKDHGGDLEEYGLDEPAYTVTLWLAPFLPPPAGEGAEPLKRVIKISAPVDGQVFITRDDGTWVARAAGTILHELGLSEAKLKSKRLFAFDRSRVARLELQLEKAGRVVVEKQPTGDNEWRMLAPEPARAKPHLVTSLVLAFVELAGEEREAEGEAVKDPAVLARTGLDDPQVLTFKAKGGKELGTLLLGERQGEDAFAMAEGGQYIVRVPASRLDVLPLNAAELIDKR